MYKQHWIDKTSLRDSTILTTSYVASSKAEILNFNQLVLYVNFTIGSLTYGAIKIQFSSDGTNWYNEGSQVSEGSGVLKVESRVRKFYATNVLRIPIPITDKYVRVQCIGNGTVANSLMDVELQIGSTS